MTETKCPACQSPVRFKSGRKDWLESGERHHIWHWVCQEGHEGAREFEQAPDGEVTEDRTFLYT